MIRKFLFGLIAAIPMIASAAEPGLQFQTTVYGLDDVTNYLSLRDGSQGGEVISEVTGDGGYLYMPVTSAMGSDAGLFCLGVEEGSGIRTGWNGEPYDEWSVAPEDC